MQNPVLFGTTSQGEQEQRAVVSQMAAVVRNSYPADLVAGMASLLPEVDATEITDAYGADNAVHMHHALAAG
ncbi:hypothetical protein [Streptomyces sp. NPDC102462]|uniref:hypothetical protein n=1 Tax=Streptomyces sp. NPDC102462 TaxID=3366178 RepID=UPI0038077F72